MIHNQTEAQIIHQKIIKGELLSKTVLFSRGWSKDQIKENIPNPMDRTISNILALEEKLKITPTENSIKIKENKDPIIKRDFYLNKIINSPMKSLKFKDFVELKVKAGKDQFSKLRGVKLWSNISTDISDLIEVAFETEKDRNSCARWVLRGLPINKAIRKVKVDLEITENARKSKQNNIKEWSKMIGHWEALDNLNNYEDYAGENDYGD